MPKPSKMEQLEQSIQAMLSGTAAGAERDDDVQALVRIASSLSDLPRESFRARLKSELERKAIMATQTQTAIKLQTATPRLRVRNAGAAVEFYTKAFGARELMRFEVGGVIPHAEMALGNSQIVVSEESPELGFAGPETLGGSPVAIRLMVDDADAAVQRAVAEGATLVVPVSDQFYGDRTGSVLDPFGYTWNLTTRKEELSLEEMHRRFEALQRQATPKEASVNPIPKGYHTITPYIVAENASALIDFLKQTFGAEETFRTVGPAGGIHAEVKLDDSMLMIGGGGPGLSWRGDPMPTALHVYVKDVDAVHARAVAAGGVTIQAPADQEYGERGGSLKDPAGNHWYIATAKGANYVPEGLGTVNVYLHPLRAEPVIAFLKKAFGATDVKKYPTPDGVIQHAQVRIGDSVLEMGEAQGPYQPMPTMFYLYVPNVDELYERAISAGATSISAPADQSYGDRSAGVKDVFGNQWYIATHVKDVS
ncbi:MAG TPA: VOC family protein [Bryobacteraceae bacterium]